MTDGRTDGGDCNIPDAFLKKRGDNYLKYLLSNVNQLQLKMFTIIKNSAI